MTTKIRLGGFVVLIASLLFAKAAVEAAAWEVGNDRGSQTGVKATISTPSSAPALVTNGTLSSWVSGGYPSWVQVGWLFIKGESTAHRYVEVVINGSLHSLNYYGTQSWGTTVNYTSSYGGSSTWYGYINGVFEGGGGPIYSPNYVAGRTETQPTCGSQMSSTFSSVSYEDSSGGWHLFDQANWLNNANYSIHKYANYNYEDYGPAPSC